MKSSSCRYWAILLIICSCGVWKISAQVLDNRQSRINQFKNYGTSSGLPGETVKTIVQDERGLLWLGVEYEGLVSYDGISYEIYRNDPEDSSSLSSNFVESILDDGHGNLWVGTQSGLNRKPLSLLQKTAQGFIRYSVSDSVGLPGDNIIRLFKDSKGRILVGTDKGLCVYAGQDRFHFVEINGQTLRVQEIFETSKGFYFLGTNRGLVYLDDQFELIDFWDHSRMPLISNPSINSIAEGPNGRFWLGTRAGIYLFDSRTRTVDPLSKYIFDQLPIGTIGVDKIIQDHTGRMWVGMISEGLFVLSATSRGYQYTNYQQLKETGYIGDQVRDIYEDHEGLIWIATKNAGIYQYNYQSETFGLITSRIGSTTGLNDNCVLSVAEDQSGNLFFGTMNGGLNVLNTVTGEYRHFVSDWVNLNSLLNNRVQAISIDTKGKLWIGTVQGVTRYDPASSSFENLTLFSIRKIIIGQDETVWIGGRKGLWFAKNLQMDFQEFRPSGFEEVFSDEIYALLESADGHLWIGFEDMGLAEYDPETGAVTWYNQVNLSNRLEAMHVRSLHEDVDGTIWVGTKLNGLYNLHRENKVFHHVPDSLIDTSVFSILSDDNGMLWLGTNKGIIRYSPGDHQVERFGKKHGLQGDLYLPSSHFKSANGTLFFGGHGGLNYFKPGEVTKQTRSPKIYLKSVRAVGSGYGTQSNEDVFEFKFGDHLFFDFYLSDYSSPQENTYVYRLIGADQGWVNSGTRNQVSYANLSPGDYSLHIMGTNPDGVESENKAQVDFSIRPPWWLTLGAKIAYAMLGMGLLYASYLMISYKSRKQHELNVLNLEKEQAEKLSQMKIRFFTNISHELRTPLTLMLPSAEKVYDKLKNRSELSKHTGVILKSVKTLLTLIEELIQFRRIEEGKLEFKPKGQNVSHLLTDVFEEFRMVAEEKNLNYGFHRSSEDVNGSVDAEIIRKIVRNLLSNAIKYTNHGGTVNLKLSMRNSKSTTYENRGLISQKSELESRAFIIEVQDTGIGMSAEAMEHIFDRFYRTEGSQDVAGSGIGLDLVKSMVDLHGGSVSVKSTKNAGSTFRVEIPFLDNVMDISQTITSDLSISNSTDASSKTKHDQDKNQSADHLLIVEDDEEILDMLNEMFVQDYHVTLAKNGLDGWEKALEFPQPNLIITDVMMPEMDGYEFCTKVKQNFKTSHIPVLILTAKSSPSDEVRGHELGGNAYVKKPFYPKVLQAKVKSLLDNQKLIREHFRKELRLSPSELELPDSEKDLLKQCVEAIEQNMANESFGVESLSKEVGISRTQLFRKLKYLVDLGPFELIYSVRLKRACDILKSNQHSISEVSYMTGFSSPNSFSTTFKKHYKLSPTEFVKKERK